MIEDADLDALVAEGTFPLPPAWRTTTGGEPMPDFVAIIREIRDSS